MRSEIDFKTTDNTTLQEIINVINNYLNEKNKTEVIEEALQMYYNLAKFNGINASKKYASDE